MAHICVSKLTNIDSDNGLSPDRCQAIIRTTAGISLIGPLGTNFSEILIEIHIFSFKKMHFKMSSAKWRPFCLGLNVITPFKKERIFISPVSSAFDLWDVVLPSWNLYNKNELNNKSWPTLFCFNFRISFTRVPAVYLTHKKGLNKMAAILQRAISYGINQIKLFESRIHFHLNVFLRVPLTTCYH